MTNSVTFNVCKDNAKAADALVAALTQKGHKAELLEVPAELVEHCKAMKQKSPPAAVAHDAPASVAVPLMVQIEKDNS